MGFEEIDHTADWAYRVRAPTMAGLYEAALEGLYTFAGINNDGGPSTNREVCLEAGDAESLLIAWLNEALYLLQEEHAALSGIHWEELTAQRLRATAASYDAAAGGKYIKAATYSGLRILQTREGFEATIVLDV
jgi:SHS2 domain-containing protein